MNQAIVLRVEFAKKWLSRLNVNYHTALIGGSVAKGWADDYLNITNTTIH